MAINKMTVGFATKAGFVMAVVIGIILLIPATMIWAALKLWPVTLAFLVLWASVAVFYYWEDHRPDPSPFERAYWDE